VRYAQGFSIETHPDFTVVQIKNPWNTSVGVGFARPQEQRYILVPKNQAIPENLPNGIVLHTPLEKTVAFSAVVCGMLEELDALPTLVGVAEPQYIDIPTIQNAVKNGTIQNVGQASNPNIEQLMLIQPEAILSNPVDESGLNLTEKLHIPTIPCLEWMETHPLGQAEWIRFIGLLFDKKDRADSLFFATVKSYNSLKDLTKNIPHRPTVFVEKKYGDFWYMPAGESYFAHLLQDAGANYIFKNLSGSGAEPLAFETVLNQAEQADFWLFRYYSPHPITYQQLANEYANYTLFDAYTQHNIYACNTQTTANYYREIPLHPDWILRDLIAIFHPEMMKDYQNKYYVRIK
jgi:iron complex transport system substrate-binding protein